MVRTIANPSSLPVSALESPSSVPTIAAVNDALSVVLGNARSRVVDREHRSFASNVKRDI